MTIKKGFLLIILCTAALCSCSDQQEPPATVTEEIVDTIPTMIMQIRKCNRLYTTELKIHKIVTHDDEIRLKGSIMKHQFDIGLPAGKRKVAIPMDATVKAYVDFSGFSEKNVQRTADGKITITLPDPRIVLTGTKVNHDEVRQYVAFTRSNFTDAELADYEQQGRQSIIQALPEMGIVENARANAAHTIIPLIVAMGWKEENVTVVFRKDFQPEDMPQLLENASVEKVKK